MNKAEKEYKDMVDKYEEQITQLKIDLDTSQSASKELITKLKNEFNVKQKNYEEKLVQLNNEVKKLQEGKNKLEKESNDLKIFNDQLKKELESTMSKLEVTKKSYQEEVEELSVQKIQEQKALEAKYKGIIDKLIGDQIQETEDLKVQFTGAQNLLDQKYTHLEEKYEELQELYDKRPSKAEDIDLIKQLQEQYKEKEAQLKKAAEDMKFYKLELINREDNYNKVFGNKPVVGFYNSLTAKVVVDII